jgi:3-hydroxybutyryl-CoA dehydrogenase
MDIKTIGIVGAGAIGRGIAYLAAAGGYRVVLEDVSRVRLEDSVARIAETDQKAGVLANIVMAHSAEDVCREADLLIEAAAEEMEVKLEIFTLFDRFAKPGTILASTTASISIADLAAITFCAENCVGMRFNGPVLETKRLEILRAPFTSEAAVAACVDVGRRMGKEVAVVREPTDSAASAGR